MGVATDHACAATELELSVLVAAHSEEKRIERCLAQLSSFLRAAHPRSEIVVSEDGSKDRTATIISEFKERNNGPVPVIFLHSSRRLGKGAGLKRAIHTASGRYAVFIDADLPVPLESITAAVAMLEQGADLVVGSRTTRGSSRNDPFLRRVLSHGFHILARLLLGIRWDSQCGFKALRTFVGRKVLSRVVSAGFAFDVDLLLNARRIGARIVEIPVQWRCGKHSSVRLPRDVIRMFTELMKILFRVGLS